MSQREWFDAKPKVRLPSLVALPLNPESIEQDQVVGPGRFPSWLHRKLPRGNTLWHTQNILRKHSLNTVCEEAKCPNRLECHSSKTATFLAMGKHCTRNCGFCDIDFAKNPAPLQADEPQRIAAAVKELGLKHVVITMVARDDLSDGGSAHLAQIITTVRQQSPAVTIEVLTSDFEGNFKALDLVLATHPAIFNHNIETVRELTPRVRHKATYERTLDVLRYAKNHVLHPIYLKSGLMVGLGETHDQVLQTLHDLKDVGCDIVTMGQYLQADARKLRVKAFITPQQFQAYRDYGHSIGIKQMVCGPFVRSSYHASDVQQQMHSLT